MDKKRHDRVVRFTPVVKGLAKDARVVRGGSFNNNHRNVRCAYRNNNNPNNANDNNGFRVVVASHNFPALPEIPGGYGCRDEALDGWPASWLVSGA